MQDTIYHSQAFLPIKLINQTSLKILEKGFNVVKSHDTAKAILTRSLHF